MSIFFAIIIIVLVWFTLIVPFIRLIRISRQWRNTFKQARQYQQQDPRRQQQQRRPKQPVKKKKIDPSVGEYVEFTETVVEQTETEADGSTRSTHTVEQQITDVTWEDLPGK